MKCPHNHNCFSCPEKDCISGPTQITPEIRDINNALFGWDLEIRQKRVTSLLCRGYSAAWIKAAMNLTDGEFEVCARKAAKRLQPA